MSSRGRRSAQAAEGLLFPIDEPQPEPPPAPRWQRYAQVAIDRPLHCEFTYGVPPELESRVSAGVRVAVPFAGKRLVAVVVGTQDKTDIDARRIKPVADVLDPEPVVGPELLSLTQWMAERYACSWGEALAAVLPAALKRETRRRRVTFARAAPGVGDDPTLLAALAEESPKRHRLLRTLLQVAAPVELGPLLRRLNLSDSPAKTLARAGLVVLEQRELESDELLAAAPTGKLRPETLLPAQAAAVEAIGAGLERGKGEAFLLYGVTGSGKTEVYLRVIEQALSRGLGAIVLVPEIALTPQTVGWFRSRFDAVAVLHSKMSDVQRLDAWRKLARGEARVVVGARSALFAPLPKLGVIVVDEEHEPSFKQGSVPRYHARDVAIARARTSGAVCILGSATPSLESWRAAAEGRLARVDLPGRVHGGALPPVEIVDMHGEKKTGRGFLAFSRRLTGLLERTLQRGEQAILFQNRRGFAPVLWCKECGETVRCKDCDVSLTFHRDIQRAVCHACCDEIVPPRACPACTAPGLRFLGLGSERVEEALRALLPDARVRRMDSDTMLRREDYEETLAAFGAGDVDVLIGTQMIAKGLDFPRVTLVGIVSADAGLHHPDFRAAERTFQLISQVAGRAGRGELEGRIVVQTMAPEHPAIVAAARHEYERFATWELGLRRELGYPPFARLIRVVIEDDELPKVEQVATEIAAALRNELEGSATQVLGPAPAPMAKVRGRHRHHLLVKVPEGEELGPPRSLLVRMAGQHTRPRVSVDVDPVSML